MSNIASFLKKIEYFYVKYTMFEKTKERSMKNVYPFAL